MTSSSPSNSEPSAGVAPPHSLILPKFLYWVAVAILAYRLARMAWNWSTTLAAMRTFPWTGMLFVLLFALLSIGLWSMLSWNVYRRPKRWGLGVGLFMLAVLGFEIAMLTLAPPHRASGWLSGDWLRYALSVTPTLLGATCCISLHWIYPAALHASTTPPATTGAVS